MRRLKGRGKGEGGVRVREKKTLRLWMGMKMKSLTTRLIYVRGRNLWHFNASLS